MIKIKSIQNIKSNLSEKSRIVQEIPIERIRPNPYQPRKEFPKQTLEELSMSIREYGLLQPITVRRISNDIYELVAGERRLKASKMIGMKSIPAIVITTHERDSAILAMIENLQREDLHYFDEAVGYASLINDHGFTQEELAKKIGKNQSTIANKIRLLKLPESIKKLILMNNLTERHARALLRLPDDELKMKVVKQIIRKKYNVKDTEMLITRILSKLQLNESNSPKHMKVHRYYGDTRIFINTIKKAVNMIKDYGLKPQITQKDYEDSIEIIVKIPKES
ncbi:MAG: nucleoid occlusion protein [Clostridiales bacterium]|jgi:ParB family chromosome partitioning protein|nr:nucleoid occlusion protein [Clostridiales bacterium]